uniref:Protein ecdysoneless n=1 Tax=Caenorhabditis tropicalis TaxID=1561998 RepID=A0A1I7U0K1_9PELO
MTEKILFYVYRDSGTSSEHLIRTIVEELKNFVFSGKGISFTSKGYSGIPLLGELPIDSPEDDIWKVLSVLFRISAIEEGLIFKVHTEDYDRNPLVAEARRSDVLPAWASTTKKFADNVFGMNGVIHLISPTVAEKFSKRSQIDMLRAVPNETRNILVTESLSEKLNSANSRNFGMHNTRINVPVSVAYIARERPDILSLAIREFIGMDDRKIKGLEKKLVEERDRVMIHTIINDTDWKEVTAVADIESPTDIVSHRVSLALLAFDEKHASIPNGVDVPVSGLFQKVGDRFEREHLESLRGQFFGAPQSATHLYQTAKALVTGNHIQECRKIFVDEGSTSNRESDFSGNEEDNCNVKYAKKQVFKKKKRSAFGKKRELAAIIDHTNAPELPMEPEYVAPDNSAFLKKFERAVNGDDYYKASSDEYSLGEEEDLELFMAKPRKKVLEEMRNKKKEKLGIKTTERLPPVSDDDEIDVADMLRAAPPIANSEDFDDI